MDPPVQADDRPPSRPARLRMPWRWSRASGAPDARPDARPRHRTHRRWRAVRPRQHPRAVPIEELGQRSAPRERTKGRPGVPTRGFCAPGSPRLPSVCTRPSFAISVTWWAPVGERGRSRRWRPPGLFAKLGCVNTKGRRGPPGAQDPRVGTPGRPFLRSRGALRWPSSSIGTARGCWRDRTARHRR